MCFFFFSCEWKITSIDLKEEPIYPLQEHPAGVYIQILEPVDMLLFMGKGHYSST